MLRKLLKGLGCLAYLAVLGVVAAAVSYASFSLFVRRGVTPVPDVQGLEMTEARALLGDQGLRLSWTEDDDRWHEKIPTGHVLAQDPQAGTLVKRGAVVDVGLSLGPQRIQVPEVLGQALQAAQVTLAGAGLAVGRTAEIFAADGTPGTVVAQMPAPGDQVDPSGKVDLYLARRDPDATYVMPDLVDRDYDTVRRFFTAQGFRLGRVSYQPYPGRPPGTVVRQIPLPGHPLERGDVIALDVVPPDERAETPPAEPPA